MIGHSDRTASVSLAWNFSWSQFLKPNFLSEVFPFELSFSEAGSQNNIWQLKPVLVLMVWKIKRKPRKCGEFQVLQLLLSLTLRVSLERHATDIRLLTGLLLTHFWLFACNFTKSNTPPWTFFTFFKLCKWFQITQRITKYVFIEVRHE